MPVLTSNDEGYPPWLASRAPSVRLRGAVACLARPPVALLASRHCPGALILAVGTWADAWAAHSEAPTLASGFQTPVEREVLRRLLRGTAPVARFPARALPVRLPPAERAAIEAGRLVLASAFPVSQRRPSADLAHRRNNLLAEVASAAVVLHAAPNSNTYAWAEAAATHGLPLHTLDHPANAPLRDLGATLLPDNPHHLF